MEKCFLLGNKKERKYLNVDEKKPKKKKVGDERKIEQEDH